MRPKKTDYDDLWAKPGEMTQLEINRRLAFKVCSDIVKPGQVWSWEQPNGTRISIRIQCLSKGPTRNIARGRTKSGRLVMCPLSRLEKGLNGSKLEEDS